MTMSSDPRPSPEALLATARGEHGGRLKIFLGAAPGVGKTYAMLQAAHDRKRQGVDIAIGIVETHGRPETIALIEGLEVIPRTSIEHNGRAFDEMDIDAIIARSPTLVLVDELAHTNAPGSRHRKRFLDVEELLAAGIDVYTTLNIQHLESLNDVVAQITGIRVRETVPDSILERADEVELVDISVEDLLGRLRDGKVYLPDQAERAIGNYFRPGNLSALRQLALRHTAERVGDQMHTYMRAHAIPGPWPTQERLLVSIGPSPLSQRLVRAARRMADRRQAEWMAVYVETPRHYRLADADRDRVARTLHLAEELGGEAITIPGEEIAEDLIRFAQSRNVTEIVIGKSLRSRWFELLHGSVVGKLIRGSGEIDIYVVTGNEEESATETMRPPPSPGRPPLLDDLLWSIIAAGGAGVAATILQSLIPLPNLLMVFLLGVMASAVARGLRASILASVIGVLIYDFFFVRPLLTFTIASLQDLLALAVFLLVAIIISNLAARIRDQAAAARRREERTAALYGLSRAIAGAVGLEGVLEAIATQVGEDLRATVALLLPDSGGMVQRAVYPAGAGLNDQERGAATWAWQHNRAAGRGTDTLPGRSWLYLPLRGSEGVVGVMAISPDTTDTIIPPDQQRLLEALADQAAVAIERARLAHDIERARLASERDRLQATLLSSISHDLRTPLASILGSVTTLQQRDTGLGEATRHDLLATIQEEAERLNRFVGNLLDITRLESGALRVNREWVEISDVIGAALSRLVRQLGHHRLDIAIETGLPLLRLDFVLVEQVFVNLLDNAARYSPAGTTIGIHAYRRDGGVTADVVDQGQGVPPEDLERIFDKFYRVEHGDRQIAGTGLGLSICRGIVEEHDGTITAISPGPGGVGTIFRIALPIDPESPVVERSEH